ncbi:hypothetical protein [Nostocoides vanveenii]|uniref:YfhO family protein n=1 Tax=Nostocoides vanveenii TaxID=330835 RepID=A0ABN2KNS0_9MICO
MPTADARLRRHAPDLVALLLALAICAPFLRRGTVIAYDLAWSPRPRWTPFVRGIGIPAPRAVPSDAVAVLIGRVTGAGLAQALILIGILTLAGAGAARLLAQLAGPMGLAGRTGAAVVAIWNPFVAERLAIGHWTVLLAYAVLAPLCAAIVRARRADGSFAPVAAWLALAGVGGANALVIAVPCALVLLAWPARSGERPRLSRVRAACVVVALGTGLAACWALPALAAQVTGAASGAAAFGARSDTAYGLVLSLVTGGGFWNGAGQAAARGPWQLTGILTALAVVALAAGVRPLLRGAARPLLGAAVLAYLVVLASGVPGVRDGWASVIGAVPGGGVLRDTQKLLAAWMLLTALAAGVAIDRLAGSPRLAGWRPMPALAAVLVPVALQPTLVWGLNGRLTPAVVPTDLLATTATLSRLPDGLVGVLPWGQYRRYPWNGNRVSLTLAPRLVDQQVLVNDALPTRTGTIAGEDARATAVSRAIATGEDAALALRGQGVRYLLIEADAAGDPTGADQNPAVGGVRTEHGLTVPASLSGATPIASGPSAVAYDLGPVAGGVEPIRPSLVAGWAMTVLTWAFAAGWAIARRHPRRSGRGAARP